MCGRFVQIIDIELFVKRFGVKHPNEISTQFNFNVATDIFVYLINNDKSSVFKLFIKKMI